MTNRKQWYFIVIALSVILEAPSARGDEFRLVPSIAVREVYNNNIFLTADDQLRDFVTTLSPGVEVVKRDERLDASARVRLDHIIYADNRDLNATDQTYQGNIRYFVTPIFGLSAAAGYIVDSQPDRDVETTGLVTRSLRRERANAALSTDYQFTEKTALSISYAYGKETFDKKNYSDTLSHEVNAGLSQDFGQYVPGVKGLVNLGYANYDINGYPTDSLMGTMGFSRDFSEIWSISLVGGARYTEAQFPVYRLEQVAPYLFQVVTDTETSEGWGWVAQASLIYKGPKGSGDLTFSRDIKPASGETRVVERNALMLNMRYRISYELSVSLQAGYYTNNSEQFSSTRNAIDEQTFRISPRVRYEFSKDIALEASHDYIRVNYRATGTQAERHLVSLRLSVQHAFLE